jgi:predicted GNAT family acetyltransferase
VSRRMVNNLELQRFEMRDDDQLAAFLHYRLRSTVLDLLHTETLPEREGSGYGSELVRRALEVARERGWQVLPSCPFVRSYIAEHPQFRDLVPRDEWARFGLDAGE